MMTELCPTKTRMMGRKSSKESIHSGHFMVSDFEAEAQDEEGLEVPEQNTLEEFIEIKNTGVRSFNNGSVTTYAKSNKGHSSRSESPMISIDGSLTKLFTTMTLAYRQNITSPKWNPFKGLKLRWKDRLRLNNVIWRCWHLQFIKKQKMTVCQFTLDVDIHKKAEAVVLEGKYWKRRLAAVTAEYKKWRVYYKNLHTGHESFCDPSEMGLFDCEDIDIGRNFFGCNSGSLGDNEMPEFDLMEVLFSPSNSNQGGFHFPNTRELARGMGNSDLLQPGLIQLQPDLPDDFMDFHEMLAGKVLPTVPEEEYFPDVEAAGLPPTDASAPSVSTPQTSIVEYSVQLTASTQEGYHSAPLSLPPQQQHPTSPVSSLFSNVPYDHIGSQQQQQPDSSQDQKDGSAPPLATAEPRDLSLLTPRPVLSPPSNAYSPVSTSSATPFTQYETTAAPLHGHPHPPPPSVSRSHSQHELLNSSSTSVSRGYAPPAQQQLLLLHDGAAALEHSLSSSSFAVPKGGASRRRSRSGTFSSASSGVVPISSSCGISAAVSVPSLSAAPKSDLHHIPRHLIQSTTSPSVSSPSLPPNQISDLFNFTPTTVKNGANFTNRFVSSPPTIFAQIVPSDSFATQCSPILTAAIPTTLDQTPLNKTKSSSLPLILPRVDPLNTTSIANPSSGITTSSHKGGLSTSKGSVPPMHLVVGGSSQPSSILPTVNLYPITPSSIKSLQLPYSKASSFSGANFSTASGSPTDGFKLSPSRHPECSPPHGSSASSPPSKPFRPKNDHERNQYKEHRRVCHINAEQKRRCNIKNNFEMLHSMIPTVNQTSSVKVSKATMLQKGAEYIQQLKEERKSLEDQAKTCRAEIEKLSQDISTAQSLLPATGAPVTHSRHNKLRERFDNYIREKSLTNWKFYIFSLVVDPLLDSYNTNVSTNSVDDLCSSSLSWLDQNCSLNVLRPIASNAMRKLSTSTGVLGSPETLQEDIHRLVMKHETSCKSSTCSSPSPSFPS